MPGLQKLFELIDNGVISKTKVKWKAVLRSVEEECCGEVTAFIDVVFGPLERDNFERLQNCFPGSIVVACGVYPKSEMT